MFPVDKSKYFIFNILHCFLLKITEFKTILNLLSPLIFPLKTHFTFLQRFIPFVVFFKVLDDFIAY